MVLTAIIIFSFLLGFKIIIIKKLGVLKQLYPERQDYYNKLLALAKMSIIPTILLVIGLVMFKIWRG